jgi:phosphoglycolate phosphatase
MSPADASRAARYRLIVFDWDGTLVDSTATIATSIQWACRDLGYPEPDDRAARYVIGLGLGDAIRHVAPALAEADFRLLSERYRHHYLAREPEIPLFAGVVEMLDELRDAGCLLGIATGKTRKGLDRALTATGLTAHFQATRCADEGAPKPRPDMLLHLMSSLEVEPEETLMIGDTTHDIELARNAGVDAVAAAYGAHGAADLAVASPLAVVASVGELRRWLISGSR